MPLDTLARAAMNAQNTGEVFLALLSLTHPDIDTPLCFVNDLEPVTSNDVVYLSWPFDLPMPELGSDTLPVLTLTIDNVDKSIWEGLKGILTPITVTLSCILKSQPDVVEAGPLVFRMKTTEVGLVSITGTLTYEDLLNEPYPYETYVPAVYPGLF